MTVLLHRVRNGAVVVATADDLSRCARDKGRHRRNGLVRNLAQVIKLPSCAVPLLEQPVARVLVPASICAGHRGPSAWRVQIELRHSSGPPSGSRRPDPTWPGIGPG